MTAEKISQKTSVPATTRLPADLDERVEALVNEYGYRSKSEFLQKAARFYVEFCEKVNLNKIRQQEIAQFYAERQPSPN